MGKVRIRKNLAPSRWQVKPIWEELDHFARRLSVPQLVAQLLYNRGLDQEPDALQFLQPSLKDLIDPVQLDGIEQGVERIMRAVREEEKIVLYGDYDVDGITGVSILWHCLCLAGVEVEYYVPHRLDEGYGLNLEAVEHLAGRGARLLITVDCGITAVEEVARARELGMDVIVTDHHTADEILPDATAIIHPGLENTSYPNPHLCGSAVAFKLAWALSQAFSGSKKVGQEFRDYLLKATALVALGTIADVVPLVGENRVLAHFGIQGLSKSADHGISALMEASGLTGENVESSDVAFRLAPRLNAAGRMGHARLAVELFTRSSPERAREIANYLEGQNKQRQKVEREITALAKEQVAALGMDGDDYAGFVLSGENWHGGVVGIVASRIVDTYHRPTVVISVQGGTATGSARSIPGFDVHAAIESCSDYLIRFGGHKMAAGVTLDPENIEGFRAAFNDYAINHYADEKLERILEIDADIALNALDFKTVEMIQKLAPFGQGNPEVRLVARNLKLAGPVKTMGQRGDHLQMHVADKDDPDPHMRPGGILRVVGFGKAKWEKKLLDAEHFDLVFEPRINRFNGSANVEIFAEDIKFY